MAAIFELFTGHRKIDLNLNTRCKIKMVVA